MSNIKYPDPIDTVVEDMGAAISGRSVTALLHVSPEGVRSDGQSWETAYTTIQDALDTASTDGDECTLILISPHTTFYDINTTGDPTWTGNYILSGTHRLWAAIKNTHASATSVFKFTGKASLINIAIFTQDTVDGVIFTNNGFRVRKCGFNSESLTGAATSIYIDGTGGITRGGIIEDIQFQGHVTHTKGIRVNNSKVNEFNHLHMSKCLTAIQIENADSDSNFFHGIDIGDCALGLDLDAGNDQHFSDVVFHNNTVNVDDEVGDHVWDGISGAFDITMEPDDFTGVALSAGAAGVWGADTEVRAAATSTVPFRVVGVNSEADAAEKFRVRFSDDSGSTHYDDIFIEGEVNATKRVSTAAPSGTEHIFNKGTRISASVKSESGGNGAVIWIEIQEV